MLHSLEMAILRHKLTGENWLLTSDNEMVIMYLGLSQAA